MFIIWFVGLYFAVTIVAIIIGLGTGIIDNSGTIEPIELADQANPIYSKYNDSWSVCLEKDGKRFLKDVKMTIAGFLIVIGILALVILCINALASVPVWVIFAVLLLIQLNNIGNEVKEVKEVLEKNKD